MERGLDYELQLCLYEFLLSCLLYPKWPASYFRSLHAMPCGLLVGTPCLQETSKWPWTSCFICKPMASVLLQWLSLLRSIWVYVGVMCAHHWVSSPGEDSCLSFISAVVTKCHDQKQHREGWVYFSSWFQLQSKNMGKSRHELEAASHTLVKRMNECVNAYLVFNTISTCLLSRIQSQRKVLPPVSAPTHNN